MIWNYAYNKPLGSYQVSECDTQKFKEEVNDWIEMETDMGSINATSINSIKAVMEKVNYNVYEFMATHSYNNIGDVQIRENLIMYVCFPWSSFDFIPINTKENKTMSDIDILYRAEDFSWGGNEKVSDFDIYCRLFFCESEEDVWDIFADGIGNLEELINYYRLHEEEKAMKALLYIYSANNKFIVATTGKKYQTIPKSVKEEVVSILKDDFFDGMYDDFFKKENLEKAKLAWDTGVVEIRQEFVRDENAIYILKKII